MTSYHVLPIVMEVEVANLKNSWTQYNKIPVYFHVLVAAYYTSLC